MTGSGVARGSSELGDIVVEVRSVNGRNLTVRARLAPSCQGLEVEFEKRVRARLRRGTVTLVAEVTAPAPDASAVVDAALAAHAAKQLEALQSDLGLAGEITLADVLGVPGVLASAQGAPSRVSREAPPQLAAHFDLAIERLIEQRKTEGAATAVVLGEHVDALAELRARAEERAPQIIEDHRARLIRRVGELLAEHGKSVEEHDVLREIAIIADRGDVREELDRIDLHLQQGRAMLARGGEIGRELEFLLQELLREVNTLGSKSPDVEMSRIVVEMKSAIDRMKEQAANLE